uniref:Uncharacterized protein n=1 Tax=viral metagenome TaxID=1070528 RepID=A0A6C0I357_9ZZZZ
MSKIFAVSLRYTIPSNREDVVKYYGPFDTNELVEYARKVYIDKAYSPGFKYLAICPRMPNVEAVDDVILLGSFDFDNITYEGLATSINEITGLFNSRGEDARNTFITYL